MNSSRSSPGGPSPKRLNSLQDLPAGRFPAAPQSLPSSARSSAPSSATQPLQDDRFQRRLDKVSRELEAVRAKLRGAIAERDDTEARYKAPGGAGFRRIPARGDGTGTPGTPLPA